MNLKHRSIFNLLEIFRQGKKRVVAVINATTHCKDRSIHDYYCDAERPHILK